MEQTPVSHRGVVLTARRCRRIQKIIDGHTRITRVELARAVCRMFHWTRPGGEWAERSCRNLLDRLHRRGCIVLPPSRRPATHPRDRPCSAPRLLPELVPWPQTGPRRDGSSALLVRPIQPDERAALRSHLQQEHYLGFRPLVGESLCYAAFWQGELVAVSAWAAASLKNRPRDAYIGWDEPTKHARLSFVANNVRFLVLPPGREVPNLASRVLGVILRRLSRDWQARYQHPLYLAETFVDESRFRGTCYQAANWIRIGQTEGFARRGRGYRHHGTPKAVWVYPLRPDALTRLRADPCGGTPLSQEPPMNAIELDLDRLPLAGQDGLLDVLQRIPEVRCRRGQRHPLVTILALAILALLCGNKSFEAIAQFAARLPAEFRKRLGARRPDPPSETTIRRLLSRLPADTVDALITEWLARQSCGLDVAIALDGKTLRGSRAGAGPAVHLLSALLHGKGIVVAQSRVPDKTNEIPCVAPLLRPLPLAGAWVTADALHTQEATATFLVEHKQADYLFFVKDNQPSLRDDIEALGLGAFPP